MMKHRIICLLLLIGCLLLLSACGNGPETEAIEAAAKGALQTPPAAPVSSDTDTAVPPRETDAAPVEKTDENPMEVDHAHSYAVTVVAPTCTKDGYTLHLCSCGDSYQDTTTPALGHDYQISTVAATTEAQGYTLHRCARCGDSYKDNYTEKEIKDYWTLEDGLSPYDPRVKEIARNYSYEEAMQAARDYMNSLGLSTYTNPDTYGDYSASVGATGVDIYLQGGQKWFNDQAKAAVDRAMNFITSENHDSVDSYEFCCEGNSASPGQYGVSIWYRLKK